MIDEQLYYNANKIIYKLIMEEQYEGIPKFNNGISCRDWL